MKFPKGYGSGGVASLVLLLACGLSAMTSGAVSAHAKAEDKQVAFKISGQPTTLDEVYKEDQGSFYDIEKKKYELIEHIAEEKYLDHFWQNLAKQSHKSVEAARKGYLAKHANVSDKEVKDTLDRFKDNPQLAKLPKAEQERQVRDYLTGKAQQDALGTIVQNAEKKGELVITYPQPQEPVFAIKLKPTDPVRYGPAPEDVKPEGCKGDACPITVVEYSEYQCPFCKRVQPVVQKLLTDYKGKVRWIVRDFPLSFHERARPAAVAAKCAADQGKYWQMYTTLYANQSNLGDEDLLRYADKIGLNKSEFKNCVAHPESKLGLVDANIESGIKLGVSGTPAYFINGRRLSGALPYEEFKRVMDEELAKKKG